MKAQFSVSLEQNFIGKQELPHTITTEYNYRFNEG